MKVWRENAEHRGYIIFLKIGSREYQSWWSSPPESCDHVGVSYLSDRYAAINTKKRAEEFKSLFKNLWIEVTDYQRELIQHCIGLDYKKKPYRNYFCTQENDKDWNELVEKGLAIKSTKEPSKDNLINFYLTKQGVEYVLGKSVSERVYKEL